MKAFITIRRLSSDIKLTRQLSTLIFLATLLHIEEICSSKVRSDSICIPSNFSVELDSTKTPPK